MTTTPTLAELRHKPQRCLTQIKKLTLEAADSMRYYTTNPPSSGCKQGWAAVHRKAGKVQELIQLLPIINPDDKEFFARTARWVWATARRYERNQADPMGPALRRFHHLIDHWTECLPKQLAV